MLNCIIYMLVNSGTKRESWYHFDFILLIKHPEWNHCRKKRQSQFVESETRCLICAHGGWHQVFHHFLRAYSIVQGLPVIAAAKHGWRWIVMIPYARQDLMTPTGTISFLSVTLQNFIRKSMEWKMNLLPIQLSFGCRAHDRLNPIRGALFWIWNNLSTTRNASRSTCAANTYTKQTTQDSAVTGQAMDEHNRWISYQFTMWFS